MASDGINPSTINLRSKGVLTHVGKIYKGCVKDATTKLSIGSIPSPYESIIYKTDCKKAFGSSEKRFYDKENSALVHGSNCDDISTVESCQSQVKVSHNRLGQNAFVSKEKREWFRTIRTPGPTHYYREGSFQDDKPKPRKCFTRQNGKKQRIPPKEDQQQLISPGPGEYIRDRKQLWQTTSKGWKSSFQTKVDRDGYIPESLSPGPGYYQIVSNAKDRASRQNILNKVADGKDANIISEILKEKKINVPGPCSYNQQIPSFKPLYQRIKMSKNFMAPLFTGRRKGKGIPGPTAYPVKRIYEDLTPKLIESTCFMSETIRDPFYIKDSAQPTSPLNPKTLGHKNFHFNIKNQWMC